jgi:hypothetical protein
MSAMCNQGENSVACFTCKKEVEGKLGIPLLEVKLAHTPSRNMHKRKEVMVVCIHIWKLCPLYLVDWFWLCKMGSPTHE